MNIRFIFASVKFSLLLFGLTMIMPAAASNDLNLLSGSIVEDSQLANNPEEFYKVWTVCDKNGNILNNESNRPYSCFVITYDEFGEFDYKNGFKQICGSGSNSIEKGEFLDIFNVTEAQQSYSYPISVTEEGNYILKGIASSISSFKISNSMTVSSAVVFVFDKNLPTCRKNFSVAAENGKTIVKVTDDSGNVYKSAYAVVQPDPMDNKDLTFSQEVQLTSEDKYLTVYFPSSLCMLGRLHLYNDIYTSVENFGISDVNTYGSCVKYIDLSGRCVGDSDSQLAPGIYIRKSASKTEKIIVR
ncbi:MAG: hypothetical protein NC204_04720 [Candidatus Amulumruptor caecigallinarius]|nr:hypothetical protein [Candidatus Amulumruptor caecigallinarius]